jgi:ABC-type transporter Mla maintaining outer membrane lipid asymmetry ATPase subunit MlaF
MTANQVQGPAIHVQGLEKSYKTLEVLRGVDFDVARGSIFALLGSNGVGKATVVKILPTLLQGQRGDCQRQRLRCRHATGGGRWRWAETSAMDSISWQRAAMARCSTVSFGVCSPTEVVTEVVETSVSIARSSWLGRVRSPVIAYGRTCRGSDSG